MIHIKEINPVIFIKYIRKEFEKIDIDIQKSALNILLGFTKGHPYYTQLICKQLEFELAGTNKNIINDMEIIDAIDEVYWSKINRNDNI